MKEEDLDEELGLLLHDIEGSDATLSIAWSCRAAIMSGTLSRTGFRREALLLSQISHKVVQKFQKSHNDIYSYDLARSHYNVAARLFENQAFSEALTNSKIALDGQRKLIQRLGAKLLRDIVASTYLIGKCLSALRRHKEAIRALRTTLAILKNLPRLDLNLSRDNIVESSLKELDTYFDTASREDELRPVEGARALFRRLEAREASLGHIFVSVLSGLGYNLRKLGQYHGAMPFLKDAVHIYRAMKKDNLERWSSRLDMALRDMLFCVCKIGFHDILSVTKEGIEGKDTQYETTSVRLSFINS